MGKKAKIHIDESTFDLPPHPAFSTHPNATIIDSHTHLISTFLMYRQKYPGGKYTNVYDFARAFLGGKRSTVSDPPGGGSGLEAKEHDRHLVEAIIDVWCDAPVLSTWREIADSAIDPEKRKEVWGDLEYWFVMGVHPHNAKSYTDEVEAQILEAMNHPRCVGWGEIGLDYHYMNSPAVVQQEVFRRQLKHAVRLGRPLTIHTREADDDVERILKEEVPQAHKVHIHCFTDTPALAERLLDYFQNLYIGITGVITYKTNQNTSDVIRALASQSRPRILLESDAPYMVPTNLYGSLDLPKNSSSPRLAFCHSGMLPWVAEFIAEVSNSSRDEKDVAVFNAGHVLELCRENARRMYFDS